MTNDELLAGFLDRSLSEDQLIEFEARKHAEPQFAHEVNEMLQVEKLLVTSTPVVNHPVDFLSAVEHTVAAKVAAGSSVGGFFSGLAANVWTWIAGASVIATGTYFLTEGLRPKAEDYRQEAGSKRQEQMQSVPQHVAPQGVPQRVPRSVAPQGVPQSVPHSVPPQGFTRSVAPPGVTQRVTSLDVTQSVPPVISNEALTTNNPALALNELMSELDKCRTANDHVRCSQIALSIGKAHTKENSFDQAENYLNLAMSEAKTARLVQFEIEANGELGRLAQKSGRINEAKPYYMKAIDLGQKNGIQVDQWSKALEAIGK